MTETERINRTPLGQEVKRIMELLGMEPASKAVWLLQYLKETAREALTNDRDGQIPADSGLLEVTMHLENSPGQYRELMQEADDLGEEYWTPQFREMREKLESYLKENPLPAPAKREFEEAMDNLMFENAWNLADGPLGELMQNLW